MQNISKGHLSLQKSQLFDGEFFHCLLLSYSKVYCSIGVKATNDALFRIKESYKYVKGCDDRIENLSYVLSKLELKQILVQGCICQLDGTQHT